MKYLVTILALIFISCQGQTNNNEQNIKTNNESNNKDIMNEKIERLLKKQLEYGAWAENEVTDIPTGYIFTEEDVNVESFVIRKILDNSGYKANQDKFNEKITDIFGTKQKNSFYVNTLEGKCAINTKLNHDIFDFPSAQIYVVPDEQIIFPILLLPQLIDYQKDYPKIALIEDKVKKSFVKDDYKVNLELWREVKDLSKQRHFNQQLLISRNKYLFNDDKSQFPWLITNDENFMESLVTTFGYTEDRKLLKWAFEKQKFMYRQYPPNDMMENYGKFLWTKQCNGDIKLHPNTLELIKELSSPKVNQDYYILNVAEYINYLTTSEGDNDLTFAQKAKIVATLLAFGEQYKYNKAYGFNQMFLGKFIYYQDTDKKYKKEFERNNYYNLPNLKEWYLKAEQEKDIFENDQSLSDDPQPNNYLYKATYYKRPYSK